MKQFFRALLFGIGLTASASAATFVFDGRLEFDGVLEPDGSITDLHTLDYISFRVLSQSTVTAEGRWKSGVGLTMQVLVQTGAMASGFSVPNTGFGIHQNNSMNSESTILDPGFYFFNVRTAQTLWEDINGFLPVYENDEPLLTSGSSYGVTLSGDIEVNAVWEGNLDNTFTFTGIPEPSVIALSVLAPLVSLRRRRQT